MTTTTANSINGQSRSNRGGFIAYVAARIADAYRVVRKQQERMRNTKYLSQMSEYQLRDIGLTRDQIHQAVHGQIDFVRSGMIVAPEGISGSRRRTSPRSRPGAEQWNS